MSSFPAWTLLIEIGLALLAAAALIVSAIIKELGGLAQVWLKHRLEHTPPTATIEDEPSDKALT